MKLIQKYRFIVQILCLILTITSFLLNSKFTTITVLSLTFLFGSFYCGWICPLGFMQDLFSKLGTLLHIKKKKMPNSLQNLLIFSRYFIFIIVTFIGTNLVFHIMSFDPRVNLGNLLSKNLLTTGGIIVICLFLIISLFFERPFCNYFCYEGAKYGLISNFRLFSIKRNKSSCINCKKCDKSCPMNIQVSNCDTLKSLQCINCFQCISNCPKQESLTYGKINMNKAEKLKYLSTIGSILVILAGLLIYNVFNGNNLFSMVGSLDFNQSTTNNTVNPSPSKSDLYNSNDKSEEYKDVTTINNEKAEKFGVATGINDGVYTGTSHGFRGPMTVKVTVKSEKIITIEVTEYNDDRKWFSRANSKIPDDIIESQSTDVDVVSGATYSSRGIINGVKNALENAK